MASGNQTTSDIPTAVTPHRTSAMATTSSLGVANPIEPPEESTVTFTQQDTPLLRLPGELRNRIYHELFQSLFDKLEADKEVDEQYDPKVLCPTLAGLTACRQIHHEAMPILLRTCVAEKPFWWRLRGDNSIPRFFARTTSFCQTLKRYAPHARFSVQDLCYGPQSAVFTPQCAKALVQELGRQTQQAAQLDFLVSAVRDGRFLRELLQAAQLEPCPVWESAHFEVERMRCGGDCSAPTCGTHWKLEKSPFRADGHIGEFLLHYKWWGGGLAWGPSYLSLEGSLAQLDWTALEQSCTAVQMSGVQV